ncbi:MAG: toprim domain-containing protein [Legionella sp.]
MNFNQIIQLFQAEMLSKGITPPKEILMDAQLHRFHVDGDKLSSKNGWYIIFNDGIPCGVFGSWRIAGTHIWCVKNQQLMNSLELLAFRNQIEQAKIKRDQDRKIQHEKASILAERLWNLACAAHLNHPYLVQKLIRPFYARQKGDDLILPIIDFFGNFWSLQFISSEIGKNKWFLPNGLIKGHFIPIQGRPGDGTKILICEGFSTGATLAQDHPNYCVIAACDAGNLKPVAKVIRHNVPNAEIIICADDDRLNSINTGLVKAREASIATGSLMFKPKWPDDAPNHLTDFNDLACWVSRRGDLHV